MRLEGSISVGFGEVNQDEFSISIQKNTPGSQPHWHDCFEIILIRDGCRGVNINNQQFLLHKNDVAIIPPRIPHYTNNPENSEFDTVVFGYAKSMIYTNQNSLRSLKYLLPFQLKTLLNIYIFHEDSNMMGELRSLLIEGAKNFESSSLTRELDMHICILKVHSIIYKLFLGQNGHSNDKMVSEYICNILDYIEKHIQENISPYEIADAVHISHPHLCRLVKGAFGITTSELINKFKLNLAERLLIECPDKSITEIGMIIGCYNTSYFIKLFKDYNGMTPRQFRSYVNFK